MRCNRTEPGNASNPTKGKHGYGNFGDCDRQTADLRTQGLKVVKRDLVSRSDKSWFIFGNDSDTCDGIDREFVDYFKVTKSRVLKVQ